MHLPGRLAASTLGDLLGNLHRSRTTGLLELAEVPGSMQGSVIGRKHRVHLFCGLIAGVDTGLPVRPLGEILHDRGFLGADGLVALMRHLAARDGRLAGEILVDEGLLVKPYVDLGLRTQLRSKVDVLFQLEDAAISFHTARPLSDTAKRIGLLSSSEFLHGRPRARDRVRAPRGTRPDGQPERRVSPNRPWASKSASYAAPQEEAAPPRILVVDEARERALRTLGLGEDADEMTIRKAFRRLALELHPDKFATASADKRDKKSALFAEVSAAYHLLVA
jgi:DnaJ-domain-containing protein 1